MKVTIDDRTIAELKAFAETRWGPGEEALQGVRLGVAVVVFEEVGKMLGCTELVEGAGGW